MILKKTSIALIALSSAAFSSLASAEFLDRFEGESLEGWEHYTGDGDAEIRFEQRDGFGRMLIDATGDRHNVWWAIIKRDVSKALDLERLKDAHHELRVEARIRVSHAPRRVNMMVNTQRTVDYHVDLREFDIPRAGEWHVISMTTNGLDAVPGDSLFVQLAATDWGLDRYHVDVDYYRASIVDTRSAAPDRGEPLIYHPPLPDPASFESRLTVDHDALLHADFPNVNFNDWRISEAGGSASVLTVSANQWPILRWQLEDLRGARAQGAALLELTTHSIARGGSYTAAYGEDLGVEFGKIRIIEIFGGDPSWEQNSVTYHSLLQDEAPTEVFNSQMTFDVALNESKGGKTYITLPRPVAQRLLDGVTLGLLIRPLGAINASVYAMEEKQGELAPRLLLNIE